MVKAKKSKFEPPYLIYFCNYNENGDFRVTGDGFAFIMRFEDISLSYMQSAQSDLVDFLDSLFERFQLEPTRTIKVVLDMINSDHYFSLMESQHLIEIAKFSFLKFAPFYYAPFVRFFAHLLSSDERISIFRHYIGNGNVDDYIKPLHQK